MVYTVSIPEYFDMDISFLYTIIALAVFTLGFGLGTIIEHRRIKWLRLDELFNSLVRSRELLEGRVVRIEEEIRHVRKEVECMYVDPDTTQNLEEINGGWK